MPPPVELPVLDDAELARVVGVVEERAQHAALEDRRSPRGNAFTIEGRASEFARKTAVVDDRHQFAAHAASDAFGEPRVVDRHVRGRDGGEDVVEERRRDVALEDHRHAHRLRLASAEEVDRAPHRRRRDGRRRLELPEIAPRRSVVCDPLDAPVQRDGTGRTPRARPGVRAGKTRRIGNRRDGDRIAVVGAARVDDARIGFANQAFQLHRVVNLVAALSVGDAIVEEGEIDVILRDRLR